MAYQTGTASSMSDLVSQLFTFAVANGWTQDSAPSGGAAHMRKGNVFVSFRWNTGTPLHLAIYHSLGYGVGLSLATIAAGGTGYTAGNIVTLAGGTKTTAATVKVVSVSGGVVTAVKVLTAGVNYTANPSSPASTTGGTGTGLTLTCTFNGTASPNPGESCDDSGNGQVTNVNSNLLESRNLSNIGNGPYTKYYFFLDSTYLHVVLEYSAGLFRHMGFGTLNKVGDWQGGEYCYGHTHTSTTPTSTGNTCLLDGLFSSSAGNTEQCAATVHMEGFTDQAATGKWAACYATNGTPAPDRAGVAKVRVIGGFRSGPVSRSFGWYPSADGSAFVPMVPVAAFYWDITPTPDDLYLLGFLPDVRSLNISAFTAGQEITVGSDTWVVFPTVRKQFLGVTDESRNQGIAYKKIP